MKRLIIISAVALCGLIAAAVGFSGTDPDAVPTLSQVSGRVMSPFCPGLTLDECPTDQSASLRAELESMIRQGSTNQEIDEWVVQNYGEVALATPSGMSAWLAPVAVGVAGLALTVAFVSRLATRRSEDEASEAAGPKLDADDAVMVEEDFLRYQRGNE